MTQPKTSSEILALAADDDSSLLVVGDITDWHAAYNHLLRSHEEIRETVTRIEIQITSNGAVFQHPDNAETTHFVAQDLSLLKQRLEQTLHETSTWGDSPAYPQPPHHSYHALLSNLDRLLKLYEFDQVVSFLRAFAHDIREFPGFVFLHLPVKSGHSVARNVAIEGVNTVVEFREDRNAVEYRWYAEKLDDPSDWCQVDDSV